MSSIRSVLIFLALTLALNIPAFSQQDPKETARQYMDVAEGMISETKAVDDARGLMVMAADLDTSFMKANFEAGHLHLLTINKDMAVKYFMRVYRQDPAYRFDLEFWIGKSYHYGLEFDKAIDYYNRYKDKLTKKPNYQGKDRVDMATVDRHIYECQNGKEFVANPGNFSIVNIGREINSEYEDYAPVLNENEDEIVFTTRRREDNLNQDVFEDNKPWEDIFYATKTNGAWSYAKNIGAPVNTITHNSNLALSADGNTLFIFNDDTGGGDIYYSERSDDKSSWGAPVPLPGIINSSFEEKSVSISSDEKTLYFSSNRPGGYGGLDIYRATKDTKGEWTYVKNLGPQINTEFNDDAPFIDYDGVTLYFSSMGRKGMGGYDVFKATYDPNSTEWSEPTNLGYPINTPDDDVFFVSSKDTKRAYYSSVREDGMGYTDIYLITIPEGLKKEPTVAKAPVVPPVTKDTTAAATPVESEPVVTTPPVVVPVVVPKKDIVPLKYIVTVVDAAEKTPLEAKVRIVGAKDNVVVASTSGGAGVYEFTIKSKQAKDYRLSVEADGYVFQNQNLKIEGATTEEKTLTRTVEMRKLSVGVTSILRNIYFDFDKATFQTDSYNELNKLEAMLRQNESVMVEIGGHTDAVGTKTYNTNLSQRRAEAVKDYLTKKGIDARRVKAMGYGESKPLASNDDEDEGRQYNRRVEFKVLSN